MNSRTISDIEPIERQCVYEDNKPCNSSCIKEKIERSQAMINKVPIWEKVTLTIDEAAEYSNIGINRINDMLNNPSCPFVLFVGRGKRLVKRREFEKYLEKTDSI